ncbi:1-acyl-sn-glycerol-3-phosphate acyltransferase 2 [Ancistrocladus abbreviatus]
MEIPAVIVILPVGLLFLLSGLIINLIQAFIYILISPVSKNMYRRFNKSIVELLWLELVWLFDWWAGVKVELHTDSETFRLMGKEHALVICNHRSDIDWLVGWVLAQRSGCLGSAVAIMKKVLKYLPVIGWSMWFSEYVFLERSWDKDESTLKSGYEQLKDFPIPFWLAIFVEGTRFTQRKLSAAQQYAISRGLPVPRNVLIPRTKGFVLGVKHMRSFVPAIYSVTLAVANGQPPPTMLTIFKGQSSVVKVHIKRHLMHELPETNDGIAQWCRDMFVAKDVFLENYFSGGRFGTQEIQDIGRPKKSLIVMIVWSCLLIVGAVAFFKWTPIFSTWQGIAVSMAFLLLVIILMQILVLFSQSEPSTSMAINIIPEDPVKQRLLQKQLEDSKPQGC